MSEATMRRGSTQRLLVFALCVLLFHVSNSIVQEAIFYIPGFHHTVLLTFAQSLCVSLFAAFQLYRSSPVTSCSPWRRVVEARRVPLRTYFMISLMNTTSVYLTNEASRLLSYSTQVVFKSSKLLFVWFLRYVAIELPARFEATEVSISSETEEVEVLQQQKKQQQEQEQEQEKKLRTNPTKHDSPKISSGFVTVNVCLPKTIPRIPPQCGDLSLKGKSIQNNEMNNNFVIGRLSDADMINPKIIREAASCVTVVLGLILFTYATTSTRVSKGAGGQDQGWWPIFTGVAGIVVALVCDAFMYLGEEKYCFMAHNATHDEVQCYVLLLSTLNGLVSLILSGGVGESFFFVQSHPVFFLLLLLSSMCNYGGTFFLLRIISEFNSSTATVVTSVRKVITVLFSYVVYPKPFGVAHFTGVLLVVGGIWQYEEARTMPSSTTNALGGKNDEDK
ncbi:UAA transporter [Trypanosoma melophagium]|uniref:UAA transporter n=1 Tax=Trypanosoma melophagium TaxID=715481 RepID=UPI00351A04E7|nr:UAA transporter [Trypanosoma melophagium]